MRDNFVKLYFSLRCVEICRVIAFLCTLGISGGIFAGACAMALLPLTGEQIVIENKQHFSAWHRYLLLISIVPITSTILLFWLPESPRFLLSQRNEVEALATYQVISFFFFNISTLKLITSI